MTLLIIAFVTAINPFRTKPVLPPRLDAVAIGAALAFGVALVLAAGADSLLDWLNTSPEAFRIGAGGVLAVSGVSAMVRPRPEEPSLAGAAAGLVPVAFPLLVTPALAVLAISYGADRGVGDAAIGTAVALAGLIAAAVVPRGGDVSRSVWAWLGRMTGAAVVVVAVVLIIDGIKDV